MNTGGFVFENRIEAYMAAAHMLFESDGENELANIIRVARPELMCETSYDNWNGGQYSHTLVLHIALDLFGKIGNNVSKYEEKIKDKINVVSAEVQNEGLEAVSIIPNINNIPNWREKTIREIESENNANMWESDHIRVFISHLSEKKDIASKLKDELRVFNISSFVAHEDIEPTLEWQQEIEKALMTMDCLVALLDDKFSESKWTDQEIGFACARGVKIIPINRGLNPYGFIGKIQSIKYDDKNMAWKIVRLIKNSISDEEAFVQAVERVENHYDCVLLAKVFEILKPMSLEYVERIVKIAETAPLLRQNTTFWSKTRHSLGFFHYAFKWTGRRYSWDWTSNSYQYTT